MAVPGIGLFETVARRGCGGSRRKEARMEDKDLLDRINALAHEEEDLYTRAGHGGLDPNEHVRLKELEVQLDQCWDLLHQRRARRRAGMDPDEASVRPPDVVEGYVD
jgi:hypothetical protein